MLKKLILNQRTIPVPVPIKNVYEALDWVGTHLLKSDQIITRVVFNDEEILDRETEFSGMELSGASVLEVQADSPGDLAVHSSEAVCNIATVIKRSLKDMAVLCWQTPSTKTPLGVERLQQDLSLLYDLSCHLLELLGGLVEDRAMLEHQVQQLYHVTASLVRCSETADWQSFAKLLLNSLESQLEELHQEVSDLQTVMYRNISS